MISSLAEYRCFADVETLVPAELMLSEEESRHLAQVRRAGPGTPVTVLNGRGALGDAVIKRVEKRHTFLQVERVRAMPAPTPHLTLALGALKQAAWDEVLKHAVELGVNRLVRVQSHHAVAEMGEGRSEGKRARMRDRLIQASKQSANPWLPLLGHADSIEEAFAAFPAETLHLLASLRRPMPRSLAQCLQGPRAMPIVVWIGPEGDFSPAEEVFLCARGAQVLSLGPRILRAETAALSLAAALRIFAASPEPAEAVGP